MRKTVAWHANGFYARRLSWEKQKNSDKYLIEAFEREKTSKADRSGT
jgi:hypothetical protein